MTRVAVLGGGVGGLSAAHELAERGFDVEVHEARDVFGGKARSIDVPGEDVRGENVPDGDAVYPGEHGFRFFPGFYQHVTETMKRIPFDDNPNGVYDNLVQTSEILKSMEDRPSIRSSDGTPTSVEGLRKRLRDAFWRGLVPDHEHNFFVDRVLTLMTSCDERWRNEYENISWWDFVEAERMSEDYKRFLARGPTKLLVAMRPEESSTRTIGRIAIQTTMDVLDPRRDPVSILDGPTSDRWIEPWVDHLESVGADLHTGSRVTSLGFDGERVTGATVERSDGKREVEADHYVLATPLEVARELITDEMVKGLTEAYDGEVAPSLSGLERIKTDWMNGVQFYLKEDTQMAEGHVVCFDSPWALTAVSQRQFWRSDWNRYGSIGGVVSVCVSDWDTEGLVHGKPAKDCSPEEIKEEVWTQLKRHVNSRSEDGEPETVLEDDNLVGWYLDPAIEHSEDGVVNHEPLFINTVGSLEHRPDAATRIENLTLAADYVRTNSDLATMEGANEAARRATNAIIERSGSNAPECGVYEFEEPAFLEPAKAYDRLRYRLGLPHVGVHTKRFFRLIDKGYKALPGTEAPATGEG
ncbi:MAG: FAD-dependent oxidoreductase [Halobacteria archaeon]|nr:FAD-dependent oxidoreductase [Halobacteria archaeon]